MIYLLFLLSFFARLTIMRRHDSITPASLPTPRAMIPHARRRSFHFWNLPLQFSKNICAVDVEV